ncbi:MAG: hypothetical protein ACFFA3_13640 [Promethearchaeota archaeon]
MILRLVYPSSIMCRDPSNPLEGDPTIVRTTTNIGLGSKRRYFTC